MILLGPIKSASTLRLVSTGSNEIQQLRWNSSLGRVRKLQHTSEIFKTRIKQMPEVAEVAREAALAQMRVIDSSSPGAALSQVSATRSPTSQRWSRSDSGRPLG